MQNTDRDELTQRALGSENETLKSRYAIYLACADDGKGMDKTTNSQLPLKSFEEWLNS